jgi:hypothetical protein
MTSTPESGDLDLHEFVGEAAVTMARHEHENDYH